MRRFIRHPTDIPIALQVTDIHSDRTSTMKDISLGGIACEVTEQMPVGSRVRININSVVPEYTGCGQIVWCHECNSHYEVGIAFNDSDEAFKSRMVQQICQIEQYRKRVMALEGRELDSNQAAAEWIAKYAAEFSPQHH